MNTVVIYATRTGNTRTIARAIADALQPRGPVRLMAADDVEAGVPEGTDLLVVGGPTEAHGMTEPVAGLFGRLGAGTLNGVAAAAFDTRLRWPRWLSGSAATGIAGRLQRSGARLIAPGESFLVTRAPKLLPGEAERAATWANTLADRLADAPTGAAR
jgi:flavodoxin